MCSFIVLSRKEKEDDLAIVTNKGSIYSVHSLHIGGKKKEDALRRGEEDNKEAKNESQT